MVESATSHELEAARLQSAAISGGEVYMSHSVEGHVSSGVDGRSSKSESAAKPNERKSCNERGEKVRAILKARLGEDIYSSWFNALEFESFDGRLVVRHRAGEIPEELDSIALRRRPAGVLRGGVRGRRADRHCRAAAGYDEARRARQAKPPGRPCLSSRGFADE